MKTLILIGVLIVLLMFMIPSKEKFYGQTFYPSIHNYYKDSYKYGLHGVKRKNHLHMGKFSDYIPVINHILL